MLTLLLAASPALINDAATLLIALHPQATFDGGEEGDTLVVEINTADPDAVTGALRDAWGEAIVITSSYVVTADEAPEDAPQEPAAVVPEEPPPYLPPVEPVEAPASTEEPVEEPVEPPTVSVLAKFHGGTPTERVENGTTLCAALAGLIEFAEPATAWDGANWTVRGRTNKPGSLISTVRSLATEHMCVYVDGRRVAGHGR